MGEATSAPSRRQSRTRQRARPRQSAAPPKGGRRADAAHGADPTKSHTKTELGPVTRTGGSDHADLITFLDRVIVPALVERFLAEHKNA